jgi:enamine deaminase RidA (YjgF/YER057c/UK114 family)
MLVFSSPHNFTQEPAKEVIEAQTRDVLAELEQRLEQAGIANPKESLVSLHVALKDAEGDGRTVFVDEFGEWLGTASPPVSRASSASQLPSAFCLVLRYWVFKSGV